MESILIVGGTGSLGRAFVKTVLDRYPKLKRLVILSRDELKQYEMEKEFSVSEHPCIRYFIGDVRDLGRLRTALDRIEVVVHAAALKQVPAAEYNPFEFIKTNVLGAENLIQACLDSGVKRVVALSTDKAAAPVNLYGATKLCSDKLFTAANNIVGSRDLRFSVVRYGNVMGSRGSVIPYFLKCRENGILPITDSNMTRFSISLQEGVETILWTIENMLGGEIFVPKIPSYRLLDLANAIAPDCKLEVIGIRPGEKIHEEMITANDSHNTVDLGDYYAILSRSAKYSMSEYCKKKECKPIEAGSSYNSGDSNDFLSVEEIRALIRKHVDSDFNHLRA